MVIKTFCTRILLFTFLFATNCKKDSMKDDELSIARVPYTGNQLRIDGYFYTIKQNMNGNLYSLYFFYQNGVIRYGGGSNDSLFYQKNGFVSKDDKYNWGVFKIDGNNIEFEKWYPSSGGPLKAYIRSGNILNDTTFIITKSMRSDGTEESPENETYYFKKFSPKPDSTNSFVD